MSVKSKVKALSFLIAGEVMTVWFFLSVFRENFSQAIIAFTLGAACLAIWVVQRQRTLAQKKAELSQAKGAEQ
ncbi:hypothetical protein ACFO4O_09980 [Glaciecola siphonariae]|uniref:Uncharacterized protein n=1 Tax=Glaciecola siphonariae TaxID=521012 RepID=A0ABV9LVE6_9ALTE